MKKIIVVSDLFFRCIYGYKFSSEKDVSSRPYSIEGYSSPKGTTNNWPDKDLFQIVLNIEGLRPNMTEEDKNLLLIKAKKLLETTIKATF